MAGRGPVEDRLDLGLVARVRDQVWRVVVAAAEGTNDVAVGLAVGVRGALGAVAREDLRKGRGRLDSRSPEVRRPGRHAVLDLAGPEAQTLARHTSNLRHLLARRALLVKSPSPMVSPLVHGGYCP